MIQSKAIDIIRELTKREFVQLGKYLESSVFTSNKKLIKLYQLIKRYYPSFSSEKLSKENLYSSVYGNKSYNDTKTRKLMSDLYKETEKFIVIRNVLARKETYDKILVEEFDTRKLDSMFISKYEEIGEYLDKGGKHYQYFLDRYLLEWRKIIFYLERGMQYKIAMDIYKRAEYLIFFFLSDLFLTLSDIESNKQAYNVESSVNLAEAFIINLDDKKLFEYIEQNNFENKDLLYSYYLAYLAVRNFDNETYYFNLKKYVLENIDNFNEWTQKAIVIFLINYGTRKLKRLNTEKFRLEVHENYKVYFKYKLYKVSGENYIRSDLFLNILTNYFAVGKITEAADFLSDNIASIQSPHRKNMLAISNALIQFERGNFAESLKNVSLIKSNTFLYKNAVKVLSMKNNYELKNYEMAKELSVNYRSYITENKNIKPVQKEKDLKFVNYYNILLKIYDGKSVNKSLKEIKKEILEDSSFSEYNWILAKIDELSKKS